jgi:type IV pilus assembly protein PilA
MVITTARRREGDEGFTLIELLISMVIFSIAVVALIPMFLGMTKAAVFAKTYTQARNLAQDQVEGMRQLPFHVDASNQRDATGAAVPTAKVDLVDNYYPALTPAATGTTLADVTTGYVTAAAVTGRAPGDPAGAFYRTVKTRVLAGEGATYRILVAAQFLTGAGAAIAPQAGYSYADTAGLDEVPSTVLAVTVQVVWTRYGKVRSHKTYTRIDQAQPVRPLVNAQARGELLKVASTLPGGVQVTASLGSVSADGSAAAGITSSVDALGASVATTPGTSVTGARSSGNAPPSQTVATATDNSGGDQQGSGCLTVCFGKTVVTGGTLSVDRGLPLVGYAADGTGNPILAAVQGQGSSGRPAFRFANAPDRTDLMLQAAVPLVTLTGPPATPANAYGTAFGGLWTSQTSGTAHTVNAWAGSCGSFGVCPSTPTAGSVVDILPTTFTPAGRGVVQIQLYGAVAKCSTDGTTPSATATYKAVVSAWQSGSYQVVGTVQNGGSALPDPATIKVANVAGVDHWLSEYIPSWTALTALDILTGAGGNVARGTTDGIITFNTVPTRLGDPSSAISVQVAPMSCYAEDNR